MRKKRIVQTSIFFAAVAASFVFLEPKHTLNFVCNATLVHSVHYGDPVFSYKTTHRVVINENREVRSTINGFVYSHGERFNYNRTVMFDYVSPRRGDGSSLIKVIDVRKSGADDIPQDLEDKYMSFEQPGTERLMNIKYTPTGDILFTSANGPFFMCDVEN